MAFATKKGARDWAEHYLLAGSKPGTYIDPINGGEVEVVNKGKNWTFPGGDSWIDDVEILKENQAAS